MREMKQISNQISPNLDSSDTYTGLVSLLNFNKEPIDFASFFETSNYHLLNAARTGLGQIIKIINPSKDKKIGIPAFICAVVVTPFLEAGYKICWIDTDENGVISVDDFNKKSDQISMVVVPHIFGQRADISKIYSISRSRKIFVIEDGAHFFDVNTDYCDVKILSFGREKVYSCVSGGAILWSKNSGKYFQTVHVLSNPPFGWTLRHVLQPMVLSLSLYMWNVLKIGKSIAFLARRIRLLPLAVTQKEKQGHEDFPLYSLPYPLQRILMQQFKSAKKINSHRKLIANKWKQTLVKQFPNDEIIVPDNCFRVILKTKKQVEIIKKAKSIGFQLTEWDGIPISPKGVNMKKFGYTKGQCPNAEEFSRSYVTFPTNIRVCCEDVRRFEEFYPG